MGGYKHEGFVEVLAAQQSPENPNWFQVLKMLIQFQLCNSVDLIFCRHNWFQVLKKLLHFQLCNFNRSDFIVDTFTMLSFHQKKHDTMI